MISDLHLFDDLLYPALFVNDKSSAHHAHVFTPTHFLELPNTIGIHDFLVGIGEQLERQVLLLREFTMRSLRIGTDTQHDIAFGLQ